MDAYERSFLEAQEIARHVPEVVLIGGWAVWSLNPRLKSRDIDLLVAPKDAWRLDAFLRARGFAETYGRHLGKRGYRLLHEETSIDVDVYDDRIGPYRVEELLDRTVDRDLGGVPVRVLRPTELLALKLRAATDRRGSEKGTKDLADLLAILSAQGDAIDWPAVGERVPKKEIRDGLRTAFADYRTASRLYPMPMGEYRSLKRQLERREVL
ncbi:MAG: nucleotidyl transferase AbiEii/AbiGii toxin family protein [Thermoplasmata archaeon]